MLQVIFLTVIFLFLVFSLVIFSGLVYDSLYLSKYRHHQYALLFGNPGDETLPMQVYATFVNLQRCRFDKDFVIVVLDKGVTEEQRRHCAAMLDNRCQLLFLREDEVFDFMVERTEKI